MNANDVQFDLEEIMAVVDNFVLKYISNIQKKKHVASGELIDNIDLFVEYDGRYISIKIMAPEYWETLETGIRKSAPYGFNPPFKAILSWVLQKGLPKGNYGLKKRKSKKKSKVLPRDKQQENLAWAIIKTFNKVGSPSRNGIRVQPDKPLALTIQLTKINKQIEKCIELAYERAYDKYLENILNEL